LFLQASCSTNTELWRIRGESDQGPGTRDWTYVIIRSFFWTKLPTILLILANFVARQIRCVALFGCGATVCIEILFRDLQTILEIVKPLISILSAFSPFLEPGHDWTFLISSNEEV